MVTVQCHPELRVKDLLYKRALFIARIRRPKKAHINDVFIQVSLQCTEYVQKLLSVSLITQGDTGWKQWSDYKDVMCPQRKWPAVPPPPLPRCPPSRPVSHREWWMTTTGRTLHRILSGPLQNTSHRQLVITRPTPSKLTPKYCPP